MLTSRQKLILKAIVEIYGRDIQPVGSKALTEMPYLNYSSATIRYDMARLEELGYLEKTHTSSGRIPSEMGYRYYINNLVTRDDKIVENYPLVDEIFIKHSYERKSAIQEAIKLISNLTNYTTVAIGPTYDNTKIKKIDFIGVSNDEAVILIVTDRGHVEHHNIRVLDEVKASDLGEVIKTLDDLLRNKSLAEATQILEDELAKEQVSAFLEYQHQLLNSFINAFAKFAEDSFYLSGLTNVFNQPEFSDVEKVKSFVDLLQRKELVSLIGTNDGIAVTLANEIEFIPMQNFSIISIPYKVSDEESGKIAVLGPSRMDYSKIIPLLEYIASNLGKLYRK